MTAWTIVGKRHAGVTVSGFDRALPPTGASGSSSSGAGSTRSDAAVGSTFPRTGRSR